MWYIVEEHYNVDSLWYSVEEHYNVDSLWYMVEEHYNVDSLWYIVEEHYNVDSLWYISTRSNTSQSASVCFSDDGETVLTISAEQIPSMVNMWYVELCFAIIVQF